MVQWTLRVKESRLNPGRSPGSIAKSVDIHEKCEVMYVVPLIQSLEAKFLQSNKDEDSSNANVCDAKWRE